MYVIIMNAVLFIILIGISVFAFIIGKLFTEGSFKLPSWLDMKPFNCRKCLTTHIIWVLDTLIGLIVGSWIYIVCGILLGVCIYLLINNEEKNQWE